jgi:hypothetical protein
MTECPIWRWPLPTKYGFIHFEEDLVHKAWLNRSVSCPDEIVTVSRVLEERSPAVASASVPKAVSREGTYRSLPPARQLARNPEEHQATSWSSRPARQVAAAPHTSPEVRTVLYASSKKAAAKAPARVEVPPPQSLDIPERSAERTNSSDDEGGEWQIARSSRSAWGRNSHRNRETALLSKVDAIEAGKDRSKWSSGQKASPVDLWAPVEEEDARTDATGSTGPGGEEVTSGGSTASREQTRNGGQDRESEVDDNCTSPDDGWTQVPARKKDKKERSVVDLVPVVPVPKAGAWASRQECSRAKETPNDVAVVKEGSLANSDTPKGDSVTAEQELALGQASIVGQFFMPSRSGTHQERRCAGGRSWGGRSEAATYSKRGELVNYEVGIEQEEDFNLMRRLLVPGGGQIRRIAHLTGAKLTVRGEGSGHLEGPENKEVSNEPLMICICSAYPDNLAGARREVEELIVKLHEDYRAFCHERGFPEPELKISPGVIAS